MRLEDTSNYKKLLTYVLRICGHTRTNETSIVSTSPLYYNSDLMFLNVTNLLWILAL